LGIDAWQNRRANSRLGYGSREFPKTARQRCTNAQPGLERSPLFSGYPARAGTLAGAARTLGVRHTTVGRRLEVLEEALGASLFMRTPDGFALTDAGSGILALAEEMERAATAVERRAAGSDDRIEGVVRLTTSEAFSGFLVRRLDVLHALHPKLIVEILGGNRFFDLSRGEADLAVRFAPTTQPDLIAKRIGDAGWSVYASKAYLARRGTPASFDDLLGHDVIGFDETMSGIPGARWLSDHAGRAEVVLRGNSILSPLNATVIGMGISVLPCFLAEAEPTLKRLLPDVVGSRELWLVCHPDVARIARVRTVIDFVTELVAREAVVLRGQQTGREVAL
jgi:DNA-binding transcriptional LysR family regulator